MSITEQLNRLKNARDSISSAITSKGVTVPDGAGFEDYPSLIRQINTSDGGDYIVETILLDTLTTTATLPQQGATITLTSGDDYYTITPQTSTEGFSGFTIPLNTETLIKLSAEFQVTTTSPYSQLGFFAQNLESQNSMYFFRIRGDSKIETLYQKGNNGIIDNTEYSGTTKGQWITLEITINNDNIYNYSAKNSAGTTLFSTSAEFTGDLASGGKQFGIAINTKGASAYVRNLQITKTE